MSQGDFEPEPKARKCWLNILASCGVALLAVAAAAENLEKYLYFPGAVWIVLGTFVAGMWAYEVYCKGGEHDDEGT